MARHFTRLVAAATIMTICAGHGASASGTEVDQATATLRAIYDGPDPYGVFKSRDRSVLGRVLTPALVETWAGPEADGPQSDGSPIAWAMMTESVRLAAVTPRGFSADQGKLDVTVDAVVEGRHVTKRITWDMKKVGARWLADDSHLGKSSFRAVFAGFAPAKAPVPSKFVRGPVPLRVGEYKSLQNATCYGMTYWSNHGGSGLIVHDENSDLEGYNCMGKFSRVGHDYMLHGSCATGNGRFAPPPKNAALRISVIDETDFQFNRTSYHWCETPDYMKIQ